MIKHTLKYVVWFIVFLFPLSSLAANEKSLDGIAAIVNNSVITQSQLQTQIAGIVANLKVHHEKIPPQVTLHQLVLKQMINTKLQLQIAKRQGIDISNRDVSATIKQIAKQNHMTLAQMRQTLEKSGVNYSRYRKQIHEQLMVRGVQQQYLGEKIHVTKQDIQKRINDFKHNMTDNPFYHLVTINLPAPQSLAETNILNAKINEIMKSLQSGMSMETAAINASTPTLLIQSHDIGWHQLNQLPGTLETRLVTAKKGEVVGPIRMGRMIILVKILDIKTRRLKKVVQQYHIRQIVIDTDQDITTAEAKMMLTKIRKQVMQGEAFTNLAKHYSEANSRVKGGDLGWQDVNKINTKTLKVVHSLKPQQISMPYQIKHAWVITQFLGKRKYDETNAMLEKQIRAYLYSKQASKLLADWVKSLRKESFIKIMNS